MSCYRKMRSTGALVILLAAGAIAGCGAEEPSPEALAHFTRDEIARGARRAAQSRVLWLADLAWSLGVLAALAHPKVTARLLALAQRIVAPSGGRALLVAAVLVAVTVLAYLLLTGPFAWARGFFLERAWGLSRMGAAAFAWHWAKHLAVTAAVWSAGLVALVWLRSRTGAWWPVASWGALSALMAAGVLLWPVLVDPLFGKHTPVTEPEVLERVRRISERAGVGFADVLWLDSSRRTSRPNAHFTGLGPTRRIVIHDTLLESRGADGRFSEEALDELEVVLAHEAGHWMRGHTWKGTVLSVIALGFFFALLALVLRSGWSWAPPAALPGGARAAALALLVGTAIGFLAMPAANAVSRRMEREADRLSIELTGKREAFVRSQVDLARRNIAHIEPGRLAVFWLYSHPPVLERIAMAEEAVSVGGAR
jgi:STE24 endopeptidase